MYLIILFILLVVTIAVFYINTKEGFTSNFQDILPIQIEGNNKTISVPNNLKGNVAEENSHYISFEGDIRIKEHSCIEFAREKKDKEPNAGKIKYNGFNTTSLAIVGAGSGSSRLVKIWDNAEISNNLKVLEAITCRNLNMTSDSRVKDKKESLSSSRSLEQVRLLNPSQFQYKNGDKLVYGFIAQEVQAVAPTCTTSQKSYIANIYDQAILSGTQLTFKHFNTSDLAYHETVLYPKLQLRKNTEEEYVNIVRIIDEHSIEIDKELQGEHLVYGQEVDDFLTIDHNQLSTLTTSALQALDHQQQALDQKQQVLEKQVQDLKDQLEEEREQNKVILHRILQRLYLLESK